MKKMIQTVLLTGALLLPRFCAAQAQPESKLSGPTLGLMFDAASASVRPILGIPGAATLGAPLSPGFAIAQAFVAPGGAHALAIEKQGFRLALVRASGAVVRNLTPAMVEAPDLIEFSPLGDTAAVYYRTSERLFVLTGLNGQSPRVVQADASTLPSAPHRIAVSEDATALLLAVPGNNAAALYFLPNVAPASRPADRGGMAPGAGSSSGSAVARRIGNFQSVSALRFAGASHDALVAEGSTNTVYAILDAPGAAQVSAIGSARDGLSNPVAVESLDTRRVLVANAGSNKLTMLYREGNSAESIACGCSPAVLHKLAGNSIYRLTVPSNGPLWVLDAGSSEARVLAVPPDRSQASTLAAVTAEGARR